MPVPLQRFFQPLQLSLVIVMLCACTSSQNAFPFQGLFMTGDDANFLIVLRSAPGPVYETWSVAPGSTRIEHKVYSFSNAEKRDGTFHALLTDGSRNCADISISTATSQVIIVQSEGFKIPMSRTEPAAIPQQMQLLATTIQMNKRYPSALKVLRRFPGLITCRS